MENEIKIVHEEHPEQSAWGYIGNNLSDFNAQQAGDEQSQRICYVLQTSAQEIAGGVIAVVYWDWLYIDLMWIKDELRGQGYGRQLLALAEEEGKRRGARHAHLDTFSFQAPGFYEKHGYRVFGELKDFPLGHTRYYMTKDL